MLMCWGIGMRRRGWMLGWGWMCGLIRFVDGHFVYWDGVRLTVCGGVVDKLDIRGDGVLSSMDRPRAAFLRGLRGGK